MIIYLVSAYLHNSIHLERILRIHQLRYLTLHMVRRRLDFYELDRLIPYL